MNSFAPLVSSATDDSKDYIENPEILYECFGSGVRDVTMKAVCRNEGADGNIKFTLNSFELHKSLLNFVSTQACGDDFRDDIEFQQLYFQFIVKMDSHILSYFNRDDTSLLSQNFNYTLDFSLDVGATVLGLKKINADTGWPLRLKKGLAPNGKKLTSSVTNTKRVSFQISFLLLFIIRMHQICPERLSSMIYSDSTSFLESYYEFKIFTSRNSADLASLPQSRLKPRSKVEHFDEGDKVKELSHLIGFANILCIVKQENLDAKLYKDFILDFVTRIVEGNTSCVVRHWTGSGQTAATDRRELLYRVECERPKVIKSIKAVNPNLEFEHESSVTATGKRKFSDVNTKVKPSMPFLVGNLNTKRNAELIESRVERLDRTTKNQKKACDEYDSDLLLDIFNPEFPIFDVADSNFTMTI